MKHLLHPAYLTGLLIMLLTWGNASPTQACNVCGCSLGGQYFGILPQFQKNFIGLRWSQAKFYAYMNHQSEYLTEEYSHDTYAKVELWGRFYLHPKWQLFAFVPYGYNDMDGTEQVVSASGLGDISFMTNYLLVNTGEDKTKKFKHTLVVGAGLKLPTGQHNLEDQGLLVNRNFQMGTGSTDFILSTVYTLRYQKTGLNTEVGYKINTRNADDYLFGNQFHATSQLFYWQNIQAVSLLPNAGLYYEQAEKHREGRVIQTNTGGNALLLSAGLETYINHFSVGLNYKHPLAQRYHSDDIADIAAKDRWMVSISYNF